MYNLSDHRIPLAQRGLRMLSSIAYLLHYQSHHRHNFCHLCNRLGTLPFVKRANNQGILNSNNLTSPAAVCEWIIAVRSTHETHAENSFYSTFIFYCWHMTF